MNQDQVLLQVSDLKTYFFTDKGVVKAVDGVSFSLAEGSTLGIVGESGCGKTVTALSILRLVPSPPGRIVDGSILFKGRDLLELSNQEIRRIRGREISMIFQEPMTSLNPVFTVGNQIMEAIIEHEKVSRRQARERTVEMLNRVGIPNAEDRVKDYPNQLSGGMRQRVMIAMALCLNPSVLIADEPTTALDVTIQAQILDLMVRLRQEFHMSIVLITHDLGVIAEMASDVLIMYAGQVMEYAPVEVIFENPIHPYTQGLLDSIPRLEEEKERLKTIPGLVPELFIDSSGCLYQDRCDKAGEECLHQQPELVEIKPKHWVRCVKV